MAGNQFHDQIPDFRIVDSFTITAPKSKSKMPFRPACLVALCIPMQLLLKRMWMTLHSLRLMTLSRLNSARVSSQADTQCLQSIVVGSA